VENSFLLPRKVLHTNGFRLSVHFYIILPATLIKNPAAIAPVWLEKPERIAALAMLTVIGLLVSSIIQRQVRLYLGSQAQQVPGNKGVTAIPTAAVVLALFAQVALVQFWIGEDEVVQMDGVQPHHLLICDALGLDHAWYEVPSAQKTGKDIQTP